MKEVVENRLGFEIGTDQYEKGVILANKKLQSIIQRFGDANGVRRTPEYLAELIAEAIVSELLTEYTVLSA